MRNLLRSIFCNLLFLLLWLVVMKSSVVGFIELLSVHGPVHFYTLQHTVATSCTSS